MKRGNRKTICVINSVWILKYLFPTPHFQVIKTQYNLGTIKQQSSEYPRIWLVTYSHTDSKLYSVGFSTNPAIALGGVELYFQSTECPTADYGISYLVPYKFYCPRWNAGLFALLGKPIGNLYLSRCANLLSCCATESLTNSRNATGQRLIRHQCGWSKPWLFYQKIQKLAIPRPPHHLSN